MNALEIGLIERYMKEPETVEKRMTDLLQKILAKNGDKYKVKLINKVIPLFGQHVFWDTQPVPHFAEYLDVSLYDSPVKVQTLDQISKEAFKLPEGFVWSNIDLRNDSEAQELYELLTKHYVEDMNGRFRFDYQIPFLRWALSVPHQKPEWLVGVRGGEKKKLMAFISAIPVTIHVNKHKVTMAEVNFLCVHKHMRSMRVAPVLISEVTRRVNLHNIYQAIYTSGTVIPTPIVSAPYWHRNLNPKKLVEIQFSFKPADTPMSRFVKMHRVADETILPGIREMTKADVPAVTVALNQHLFANYKVHISFTEEEVEHFLLPQKAVVYSYLIKDEQGRVTDFTSFYALPSSVLNHPEHSKIYAAYGFYTFTANVADTVRYNTLIKDALFFAKAEKFDVYNITEVMQHKHAIKDNMFKPGDGNLAHYLYNWRINMVKPEEVGIILV